jgi:type IV pili sensor histidine kinase/response regulator
LKGYDVLLDLIEKLQSPIGLQPKEADAIVESANPQFTELDNYLNILLGQGTPILIPADVPQVVNVLLSQEIRLLLKQLLSLFKKEATLQNRQALQQVCHQLAQLVPDISGWQSLVQLSSQAIANPHHSFATLAPVVIKELKQSSDLIELNQSDRIKPSLKLSELANAPYPYILVPLEPDALAQRLRQAFTSQQLFQLVNALGSRS